jgi:putative transposase
MICSKFGIHPKSIYKDKAPRVFYKKSSDSQVLIQINAIISLRPTYGYKRVTAMVNKLRKSLGHNKVNKKRIYRIMKINGLLLPKSIVTRTHKPTGKVMTLH